MLLGKSWIVHNNHLTFKKKCFLQRPDMCVHNNHLTCLSLASKWTKGFFAGHRAICRGDVCDHGCLNVGCWSFLGAKMKMFTNIWIKVHVFTLLKSCNVWDSPPWSEISLEYVPIHPDRPKKNWVVPTY